MKLHSKHIVKLGFIIALLLMSTLSGDLYAQIGLPDGGDVDDVPEAPIDMFITIGIVVAGYLGFKNYKLK